MASMAMAANPEVVEEILSWLPPESVIRFRCVCKQWRDLSSAPFFVAVHTRRNPHRISSFLVNGVSDREKKVHETSCALDGGRFGRAFPELCTFDHVGRGILNCCNGLVVGMGWRRGIWACNPTTRQLRTLPDVGSEFGLRYAVLAFDPSRSINYRVLRVSLFTADTKLYRSETDTWETFFLRRPQARCVFSMWCMSCYFRGTLYCLRGDDGSVVAVDIERRSADEMTTRPLPTAAGDTFETADICRSARSGLLRWVRHNFQHNRGPVDSKLLVKIYEMSRDLSEWNLLHEVSVLDMLTGIIPPPSTTLLHTDLFWSISHVRGGIYWHKKFLFVEGEEDEEGRLLMRLSMDDEFKVVAYDLRSRSHHELVAMSGLLACAHTLVAP